MLELEQEIVLYLKVDREYKLKIIKDHTIYAKVAKG